MSKDKLRPVTIFEMVQHEVDPIPPLRIPRTFWEKEISPKTPTGMFHQFGVDYEMITTEYGNDSSPGNYSTAIVELPNGEVITPLAHMIMFDDKEG